MNAAQDRRPEPDFCYLLRGNITPESQYRESDRCRELPMKNLLRLAMFFAVASLALGCRVETSLVRAVKADDLETVKSILSRDSVNVDEAVGQEGMTALMYAAT